MIAGMKAARKLAALPNIAFEPVSLERTAKSSVISVARVS